ncbi:MAG: LytTR family transcriptional regulator [Treponema sp.]|jgi:DNA-binding LytR/AlgR family response regulator|nr:LytTR family transcriptional regulator [Treponema sp.]
MFLKLEQDTALKDYEISVKYPSMNKTIEQIVSYIKSVDSQIECYSKEAIKNVNVTDIYYIESIEKLAVVFCEKGKYQTKFRLSQLIETLSDKGFIRISKYCVLNINKLDKFKPLLNSRMEAILTNGAHLYINRNYLANIKRKFRENV